ncbi:MAG: hypothetical protein DI602_08340 [Aliarcobacter butzleri]|nr:MAG: hypothetical protein DI602_08340 [Aliarcobacter butzleri]
MYEYLMYFFIITTIILLLVIYFKKKFTRERYIFAATAFIMSYALILISHIFMDNSLKTIIFKFLNKHFNLELEIPKTDIEGIFLALLIFVILITFIYKTFKTWDGSISAKDYELMEKNLEITIFKFLLENFKQLHIKEFEQNKNISDTDILYDIEFKDNKFISWEKEVLEIFKLISMQYKFKEEDLDKEQKLYISKYLKNEKNIAIFYSLDEPSELEIKEKISFLKRNYDTYKIEKLIIAIKNLDKNKSVNKIDDIEIVYRYRIEMLNTMIDFSEYYDFIKTQYETKEITQGDQITIKDMYVKSKGIINDITIDDVENYILDWTEETSKKHIAILGEYGQGKSTLSLKIAYEMIINNNPRIPIIIELRGKSPRNMQLLDIISSWSARFNINPNAIFKLIIEGKILIILEGFDEIDLVGDEHIRQQHFNRLWDFANYSKSKILITGRQNLFLNKIERENRLNLGKDSKKLFYCEQILLQAFNNVQIEESLRNIDNNIKSEILNILKNDNNKNFIDLISRASTLYQVVILWNQIKINKKINSAYIIKEFINHSYKRQNEKLLTIGSEEIKPVLDIQEREYFMLGIAASMNEYTNQISLTSLHEIINKLYTFIPNEISSNNEYNLKDRLKTNPTGFKSLCNDIRTFGILVTDFTKDETFKFAHKSFLEYLKSYYFVHTLIDENSYENRMINAIKKSMNNLELELLSDDVSSFIAQQLSEKINITDLNDKKAIAYKLFEIIFPIKILRKFPKYVLSANIHSILLFVSIIVFLIFFRKDTYGYIVIISAFIFVQSYAILFLLASVKKRLKLWKICCNQLNVTDEDLIKIFNKYIIKRLEKGGIINPIALYINESLNFSFKKRKEEKI